MLHPDLVQSFFGRFNFLKSVESDRKKDIVFLLLFCVLVFLPGLGLRDPWPADEPRFALCAKQMVDSGDWFFPMRGDEYYPDKPPVFMWMIAFFYWITHSVRVAFLIPSILAASAIVILIYDLGRRLWGRTEGLAAAGSLLVMVQFVAQAKSAQIDMVLTFWTTLGLYGMIRHLVLGPSKSWYIVGCFAMGLGIITKGVGFLPILFLLPYGLARWRKWTPCHPKGGIWAALAPVFLLLGAALWFVPMWFLVERSGDPALIAYRNNILFKQTGDRYLHSWHHIKPFYFFVVEVLPWAWLPFSLLIVNYSKVWWKSIKAKDNRVLSLLIWGAMVLLFFSLTKGKRGVYVLPLAPAAALLFGMAQKEVFASIRVQRYFRGLGAFLGGLFLFTGIYLLTNSVNLFEGSGFELPHGLLYAMLPFGTILVLVALLGWRKSGKGYLALFANFILMWGFICLAIWPQINPVRSPRLMMAEIRQIIGNDSVLGMVSWKEQILLQAVGPVKTFGFLKPHEEQMEEAIAWMHEPSNHNNRWLLVNGTPGLEPFEAHNAQFYRRLHSRDWYLFKESP